MTTTNSAPGERIQRVERTIALVRFGAVTGSYLLILFGGDDARSYRAAAAVVITLAAIYSVVMANRKYRLKPEASTILDLIFTIGVIATTGAGRSIALGIPFLVLGASALRFPSRVSRATAIVGSLAVAIVILVVPRPELPMSLRAELAIGWAAALLLAAMLIALLSDLELQESADLLVERERAKSLTQQDNQRRRTLSMVAHDLTPPLVAVKGIARTLKDPSVALNDADRNEALGMMLDHCSHLQSFAISLREVANVGDLGKLQRPVLTELDLDQFFDKLCRAHTFHPSREVRFEPRTPLPAIRTDPDKLRRIIVNLLDNAVRHSPTSDAVVLATQALDAAVAITVIDSGPGVSDSNLQTIFTPYWQGAGEVGEGGMGLWIVAELATELGGTVQARNGQSGGLEVEVQLPF